MDEELLELQRPFNRYVLLKYNSLKGLEPKHKGYLSKSISMEPRYLKCLSFIAYFDLIFIYTFTFRDILVMVLG